jgi:hypothetical protein
MHGSVKLKEFTAAFTALVRLKGCKVIIIDNLTAAADSNNTNESLNCLMKEVNQLASSLRVHVLCVSHTSRESEKAHALRRATGKEDIPPLMGDAFGSSFIEKFAWNIITIHMVRAGVTEFNIIKTRKGNLGLPNNMQLKYRKGRYYL